MVTGESLGLRVEVRARLAAVRLVELQCPARGHRDKVAMRTPRGVTTPPTEAAPHRGTS